MVIEEKKTIPKEIRDELVRTTTHLFIENGFDRTTTRELSAALGWSKGRLYQYVGSKDDLMDILLDFFFELDQEFMDTVTALSAKLNYTDTLATAIWLHVLKCDKYEDLYKFFTHVLVNLDKEKRHKVYTNSRKVKTFLEDLIKRGIEAGEYKTNNAELVAINIFLLSNWATTRYLLARRYTVEEYIRENTRNMMLQLGVISYSVADTSITILVNGYE